MGGFNYVSIFPAFPPFRLSAFPLAGESFHIYIIEAGLRHINRQLRFSFTPQEFQPTHPADDQQKKMELYRDPGRMYHVLNTTESDYRGPIGPRTKQYSREALCWFDSTENIQQGHFIRVEATKYDRNGNPRIPHMTTTLDNLFKVVFHVDKFSNWPGERNSGTHYKKLVKTRMGPVFLVEVGLEQRRETYVEDRFEDIFPEDERRKKLIGFQVLQMFDMAGKASLLYFLITDHLNLPNQLWSMMCTTKRLRLQSTAKIFPVLLFAWTYVMNIIKNAGSYPAQCRHRSGM